MSGLSSCLCALALELSPGCRAQRRVLDRQAAEALAALVARDLAKIWSAAAQLDLALIGALFDPVELLRPRWPLHRELEHWAAQAPGAGAPRIIAFGAEDQALPGSLQPSPEHANGALRLLPLLLRGPAAHIAEADAHMESHLLELGMAGADTALLAQECFGVAIEHARYLTVHDLAAMMALQYQNVGLASLWPLLETALMAPGREQWLDAPPEPLVRLVDGQARIAMLDDDAWAGSAMAPASAEVRDPAQLRRGFEFFQRRQRQIAAVLQAHGIEVTFDHCPAGVDPHAVLRA